MMDLGTLELTPTAIATITNNRSIISECIKTLKRFSDTCSEAFLDGEMSFWEKESVSVFYTIAFFEAVLECSETGVRCYTPKMCQEMESLNSVGTSHPEVLCYTQNQIDALMQMQEAFCKLETSALADI